MMQAADPELILASASPGRAALLAAAGLAFRAVPAPIDEAEIKRTAVADGLSDVDTAMLLAEMKAARISRRHPRALVIGADQLLVCDGHRYDKPADLATARSHLQSLRGCTHRLVTAVSCQRDGTMVWQHVAQPELTMRAFGNAWIDAYLAAEGPDVLGSVGAYRIEGRGLHCFSKIEGEHSAIIGLPLLPLLAFLRQHGVLARE